MKGYLGAVLFGTVGVFLIVYALLRMSTPEPVLPPPAPAATVVAPTPSLEAVVAATEAEQKARTAQDPTPPAGYVLILNGGKPILIDAVRTAKTFKGHIEYIDMAGEPRFWSGDYLYSGKPFDIQKMEVPLIGKHAEGGHGRGP